MAKHERDNLDLGSAEKRRTLWTVLWLNVAIAVGFFVTGYLGDSNSLIANGLDNSSDAIVYGLSLLALTRSRTWQGGAARFSGIMLLVFAGGVVLDAIRRFLEGSEPVGTLMMAMAAVAAVVNLVSLYLLKKLKNRDVNLRAAATFSFNDFVANGGIILADHCIDDWGELARPRRRNRGRLHCALWGRRNFARCSYGYSRRSRNGTSQRR